MRRLPALSLQQRGDLKALSKDIKARERCANGGGRPVDSRAKASEALS
jgi:hypothetical protein